MDLLKQFFSFDKLMKDRLVAVFFFLGLAWVILTFLGSLISGFSYMGDDFGKGLLIVLGAFFQILIRFVLLRLVCELMIAVFHMNDNLSPDGGKSDTADLDVMEAAREAASKAAKSASSATMSVVEKTKSKINEVRDGDDDDAHEPEAPKPAAKKAPARKTAAKKPVAKKTTAQKTTAKKTTAKKPVAKKTTAKKTTTRKKPAPKK